MAACVSEPEVPVMVIVKFPTAVFDVVETVSTTLPYPRDGEMNTDDGFRDMLGPSTELETTLELSCTVPVKPWRPNTEIVAVDDPPSISRIDCGNTLIPKSGGGGGGGVTMRLMNVE